MPLALVWSTHLDAAEGREEGWLACICLAPLLGWGETEDCALVPFLAPFSRRMGREWRVWGDSGCVGYPGLPFLMPLAIRSSLVGVWEDGERGID